MIRTLVVLAVLFSACALAQEPVCSETTYTWVGDSEVWSQSDNWTPPGVPGVYDRAYIPSVGGGKQFPEISGSGAQVCALQLEKTGSSSPRVTVKSGSGEQVLFIYGQNGLDVGAGCEIRLEKDQSLSLISPGIALGRLRPRGPGSPDTFQWNGNAYNSNSNTANDNWSDEHNWEKLEGETARLWPHHDTDIAVIDDVTPEDEIEQDHEGLTVRDLFLGDGHTLNLTKGMLVKRVLECEGVVKLKGNGTLEVGSDENAIVFRVYSDEDTTITFDSGTGSLVVASGG